MNQTIFIRKATQEDLYGILALANQLSDTVTVSEQYLASHFTNFIDNEQHCLLVAVKNETVVGYVSGYFHRAIYANGLVAYVDEIVVDTSYRSMQIGSILMAHFEQASKENNCIIVSLATFGAKGFYERLGYQSKAGYFKKYLN
jgi:ribosomal protein S18 acetylase RimI-like enzyme